MLTDIHTTAGRTPCVYSLLPDVCLCAGKPHRLSSQGLVEADMNSHCAGAKGLVVREETVYSAKGTVIAYVG